MKKITLIPIAGLCNRMNAVRSAIGLAQKYSDIKIDIFWPKDRDLYARFEELFEPISPEMLGSNMSFNELRNPLLTPPSRHNLKLTRFIRKPFFDAEFLGSKISNMEIEDLLDKAPNMYIYSDNRFCKYWVTGLVSELFVPVRGIQERIDHYVSEFSENTIGVHIRRTDNVTAIKESPIEKFVEMMKREISSNENTKFYIASDSEEVKTYMIEQFGEGRIIYGDWCLSRKSVQGMKDAVAELYILGRTKKIIGSKGSTYSTMASQLFGAEIIFD